MTWPELVAHQLEQHDVEANIPVLFERYQRLWQERSGYPCVLAISPLQYAKLGMHLRIATREQLEAGLAGYFATDDTYVQQRRHPLGLWLAAPLQHAEVVKQSKYVLPCPHEPRHSSTWACCRQQDLETGRENRWDRFKI